jgi:hypothetical protein
MRQHFRMGGKITAESQVKTTYSLFGDALSDIGGLIADRKDVYIPDNGVFSGPWDQRLRLGNSKLVRDDDTFSSSESGDRILLRIISPASRPPTLDTVSVSRGHADETIDLLRNLQLHVYSGGVASREDLNPHSGALGRSTLVKAVAEFPKYVRVTFAGPREPLLLRPEEGVLIHVVYP